MRCILDWDFKLCSKVVTEDTGNKQSDICPIDFLF